MTKSLINGFLASSLLVFVGFGLACTTVPVAETAIGTQNYDIVATDNNDDTIDPRVVPTVLFPDLYSIRRLTVFCITNMNQELFLVMDGVDSNFSYTLTGVSIDLVSGDRDGGVFGTELQCDAATWQGEDVDSVTASNGTLRVYNN